MPGRGMMRVSRNCLCWTVLLALGLAGCAGGPPSPPSTDLPRDTTSPEPTRLVFSWTERESTGGNLRTLAGAQQSTRLLLAIDDPDTQQIYVALGQGSSFEYRNVSTGGASVQNLQAGWFGGRPVLVARELSALHLWSGTEDGGWAYEKVELAGLIGFHHVASGPAGLVIGAPLLTPTGPEFHLLIAENGAGAPRFVAKALPAEPTVAAGGPPSGAVFVGRDRISAIYAQSERQAAWLDLSLGGEVLERKTLDAPLTLGHAQFFALLGTDDGVEYAALQDLPVTAGLLPDEADYRVFLASRASSSWQHIEEKGRSLIQGSSGGTEPFLLVRPELSNTYLILRPEGEGTTVLASSSCTMGVIGGTGGRVLLMTRHTASVEGRVHLASLGPISSDDLCEGLQDPAPSVKGQTVTRSTGSVWGFLGR
jgi:hypothetical protein